MSDTAPDFPAQPRPSSQRKAGKLKHAAMLPNPHRNTFGRPTKFKPEYCELVERWGREGKSKSEMCSLLNIGRATFHDWERDFPTFAASLSRAREHAQAWWEAKAQKSLGRKHFQAQLWRYSMAGRFKEDYAEQRTTAQDIVDLGAAIADVISRRPRLPGDAAKPIEAQLVKDDAMPATQDVEPGKR